MKGLEQPTNVRTRCMAVRRALVPVYDAEAQLHDSVKRYEMSGLATWQRNVEARLWRPGVFSKDLGSITEHRITAHWETREHMDAIGD